MHTNCEVLVSHGLRLFWGRQLRVKSSKEEDGQAHVSLAKGKFELLIELADEAQDAFDSWFLVHQERNLLRDLFE